MEGGAVLCDELVVGSELSPFFDCFLCGFDRFRVVFLLKVDRYPPLGSAVVPCASEECWNGPERLLRKVMSWFVAHACS